MIDCAICLKETQSTLTLMCSHQFCQECISCWLTISNKCPLCLQLVNHTNLTYKSEQEQEISTSIDYSTHLLFLQRRLLQINKSISQKIAQSQNIKSTVSKVDVQKYQIQYQRAEEQYEKFLILVMQKNDDSQMNSLLETINFRLLSLQNTLSNGIIKINFKQQKRIRQQDYEQDFPELGNDFSNCEKKNSNYHKITKKPRKQMKGLQ